MSDNKSPKWAPQAPDAWVQLIPDTAEALVAPHGDVFEAAVYDYRTQQVAWPLEGEEKFYLTLASAKRGGTAALKRLGYLRTDTPLAETEVDQVEHEPSGVPPAGLGMPQSIWLPTALQAVVKGKGIAVTCFVTVSDGCVEGIAKLGSYVFREEYPDEWSAKRGVLQRANTLIDWHA
ncbi:hypothetical protein [Mesorhizobium sophorae]|uniref:hypothetical protein n=1 Tax=Mesorhizobium sophorae TaxID=1300294 RepID=UPI000BA4A620|nr:hypothetical protein [Mesorhizobium sophorae]